VAVIWRQDAANEKAGREKLYQGLNPNPSDPDDDEYGQLGK